MTFSGSQHIEELRALVDRERFESTINRISGSVGFELGGELLDRICQQPMAIRLAKWEQVEVCLRHMDGGVVHRTLTLGLKNVE